MLPSYVCKRFQPNWNQCDHMYLKSLAKTCTFTEETPRQPSSPGTRFPVRFITITQRIWIFILIAVSHYFSQLHHYLLVMTRLKTTKLRLQIYHLVGHCKKKKLLQQKFVNVWSARNAPTHRPWEWHVAAPTVFRTALDRQPISVGAVDTYGDVASTWCVQISGGQRAEWNQSACSNEQQLSQSRASTTGKKWRLIYGETTFRPALF